MSAGRKWLSVLLSSILPDVCDCLHSKHVGISAASQHITEHDPETGCLCNVPVLTGWVGSMSLTIGRLPLKAARMCRMSYLATSFKLECRSSAALWLFRTARNGCTCSQAFLQGELPKMWNNLHPACDWYMLPSFVVRAQDSNMEPTSFIKDSTSKHGVDDSGKWL